MLRGAWYMHPDPPPPMHPYYNDGSLPAVPVIRLPAANSVICHPSNSPKRRHATALKRPVGAKIQVAAAAAAPRPRDRRVPQAWS